MATDVAGGNAAEEWSDGTTTERPDAAGEYEPKPQPEPLESSTPAIASHDSGPPDGGLWAWLQVLAGFCAFFNTWGMLNTFGIFQTYYESGALFVESSSNISWIGAIQAYCVLCIGMLSGPIYDRGHYRLLLLTGTFMIVFGFMMLSICKTFWEALLAQGFCVGIGAGMLFVPCLAILPTYFRARLGLAMGLAASGSSFGGVIYPIVFYKLIDRIGFGWTVRTIAFIALATLLIPLAVGKMRVKPARPRAIFDATFFTDWPFLFFIFSALIGFSGLYVVLFYISYFGEATQILTPQMAFYLVPILNATSMLGRTLPNALSDKTGPMNSMLHIGIANLALITDIPIVFGPASLICGILTFALIGVKSMGGIIAIAALYGFFSGVFVALPSVAFVSLTADKSKIGTRFGMGFALVAFGILAGGPGGGAVLGTQVQNLHWQHLWIYGGTVMTASGVLLIMLRFWLTKGKMIQKI